MRIWAMNAVVLALAACQQPQAQTEQPAQTAQAPASGPVTVEAAGPPVEVALSDPAETYLQAAASVYQIFDLNADGAKIFTTVGGDPAINGVYTFMSVFESVTEGWRIFQIGDFNEVKLLDDRGDTVALEVSRSFIDENGEIQTRTERLIVSVPQPTATSITVTPAK